MEEDSRFSHVATDPKFRRIPKAQRKVKIDNRFKSMFKDKKFKVKYTVDKRGRPVNHSSSEDLKRYYQLSSGEESSSESEHEDDSKNGEVGRFVRAPDDSESDDENEALDDENELNSKDKNDKSVTDVIKKKLSNLNVDYARGESRLLSDSSSDDEESEEDEQEDVDELEHAWGELDKDAESTEEATYRLAACNMDWDRMRAVDLMVLFNSFLPPGGFIKSVTIYPSEFGMQRMKEEEINGPRELVENTVEEEVNNEEGSKYHMEKLRQYQLNRLKYYYALITCDSVNTANKIYTECDGMEYESTATKMDLRFVPDDMTFEQEPKEICEKIPEQGKYQPRFFTTTALQQAKVNLTWDETNPERIEVTEKLASGNLDNLNDADLHAYLASSSGEESEKEEVQEDDEEEGEKVNSLDKYKALLQEIEKQEEEKRNKDVQMQVTWGLDLKGKTQELVKKKINESVEKTPFQEYLEKRKEKRKQKKELKKKEESEESDVPSDIDMNDPYFAEEFNNGDFRKKKDKNKEVPKEDDEEENQELELLLDEDDGKKHFNLKKIMAQENQSKSKKKKSKSNPENPVIGDDFEVDVKDARFSALFSSHHFNIDPTDSHYKKTKGMEALIQEKIKRRTEESDGVHPKKVKKNEHDSRNAELNVLVKSVKRKAEMLRKK